MVPVAADGSKRLETDKKCVERMEFSPSGKGHGQMRNGVTGLIVVHSC